MLSRVRAAALVAKAWLFSIVLAFALSAPDAAVADGLHRPVDRIVVFGDSLSDPGNAYQLCRVLLPAPAPTWPPTADPCNVELQNAWGMLDPGDDPLDAVMVIPSLPYAVSNNLLLKSLNNHFSNGPTWIEQLGSLTGLGWSVRPAFVASVNGSSNYAVGGTRAHQTGVTNSVLLSQQVGRFLQDVGGNAPSNALYVVAAGALDVKDALFALIGGEPAIANAIIEEALDVVEQSIRTLHGANLNGGGAKKFLVWNVPNFALTPAIKALNSPVVAQLAMQLTVSYNLQLNARLDSILNDLDDIKIIRFNTFERLQHVVDNSEKYGLQNDTEPCIRPLPTPSQCANPDRYLFWDGIHPTRAGHAIIAFEVVRTIVKELQDH